MGEKLITIFDTDRQQTKLNDKRNSMCKRKSIKMCKNYWNKTFYTVI